MDRYWLIEVAAKACCIFTHATPKLSQMFKTSSLVRVFYQGFWKECPRFKCGCSLFPFLTATRSLVSVLEGANQLWNVVVIVVIGGAGLSINASSDLLLQELVLLGSDLLENIWHHFFEALGLGCSWHNQKILSHRERGCTRKRYKRLITQKRCCYLLYGLRKWMTVWSSLNMFTSSISCNCCMPMDERTKVRKSVNNSKMKEKPNHFKLWNVAKIFDRNTYRIS